MTKPDDPQAISPLGGRVVQAAPAGLEILAAHHERLAVTVLDDDLVRVRLYPDGQPRLDRTWLILDAHGDMPLEGRDREDLSPFPLPGFKLEQREDACSLTTRVLRVEVDLNRLALRWSTPDGQLLAADLEEQAYAYVAGGDPVSHHLRRLPGERYYGFGEVSGPLDKSGRRILMKNIDHPRYNARTGSPLYKHIPFYVTFHPESGQAFGLLYDNLATTTFDLVAADRRSYSALAGDIDYYFIYGPSPREVVEKLTRLTGRMLLPPRWSLGYMGSTMTYTEAPDAQARLGKFIEKCRAYEIPCDLFHLSSGYTTGADGKRYVFNWNRRRVPEPCKLVEDFHAAGIHLTANIKPSLLLTHPKFKELEAQGAFIRQPDTDEPAIAKFWGGPAASLDFSNPAGYQWWKQQVKEQLLAYGFDSTWNDNNEFEVQEPKARCMGFGRPFPVELARPLQTLLMLRASYEAQIETAPDERPFLISRAGAPGMQRFAQTWSGDNLTSWETLRYNLPMGLGLGLSGVANTGHDVGGFGGHAPSPELFLRWVQSGIFHPRFTIHSWKPTGATEPWMYPQLFPLVQEAIYFRYRLIPYLYNLAVEAAETGHPIIRPLVYEFPADPRVASESFDFMLGPALLVASVLTPRARSRRVYLPAGQDWYDFYTHERLSGGKTHTIAAPLERTPLLAREGSFVPMGEVVHPQYHARDDLRQVHVFPHFAAGETTFELTEDDGHSLAYRRGEITRIRFQLTSTPRELALGIDLPVYRFPLPYSELELIFPAGETRPVTLPGASRRWLDERSRVHLAWPVPQFGGY